MPPRDSRTVSDVAAEKRRRKVKIRAARKNPEPAHRDYPTPRFVRTGDLPSERPTPRPRGLTKNFVTGKDETNRPGLNPLGAALKPIGEYIASQALAGQAARRPGDSVAIRAANNPKLAGASAGTRAAYDIAVGPETRKALQGSPFSKGWAGVEIAGLLPLAKPLRGSRAGAVGIREALKTGAIEKGYKAAEDVYEGSSLASRVARVPSRDRRVNEAVTSVAAARSRTGRVVERDIDKARPVIGKIPGIKNPDQVWAADTTRRIVHDAKQEALPGVLADASIKKLSKAQKYALYSMGTETSPERWIEFYGDALKTEDDPVVRAAIKTHIANFDAARKYVSENMDDGSLEILGGKGADKLQRAYGHLQASSSAREAILTRGGYLDPDTIAARRSAPGRIARGARWTPEEIHANNVIKASPARAQLKATMESMGDVDPQFIEAQLRVLDQQARGAYSQDIKLKTDQLSRIRKRMDDLIESGDPDEELIQRLDQNARDLEQQIQNTPYDQLYQHLAASQRGYPDAVKQAMQAKYPDAQVHFNKGHLPDKTVIGNRTLANGTVQASYTFYPSTKSVLIHDWTAIEKGNSRAALRELREMFPGARIGADDVTTTTGAESYWRKMLDEGLVDDLLDDHGAVIATRPSGEIHFKYDAPNVVYPPEKISARLKSKLNPRNAEKGLPTNPKIFRNVNGKRVQIAGPVSPQAWVKRVEATVPDLAERDSLARWYEKAEDVLRNAFGADADKIMRGFAVSQANDSPAGGIAATLKVLSKLRNGETITENEISVVVKSIEAAVKGEQVSSGVAAKLSDFIDSLVGKETRTWMGDLPEGGAPAAVDVHAIRDRGFVDQNQVARLEKQFGLKAGTDYVPDSTGGATGPMYERISEWYADIADHLNKTKFDGRTDWTPAQAQALGWSVIQRVQGVTPQDLTSAVARNTRSIDFEATQGVRGLGSDLTLAQSRMVAERMQQGVLDLATDSPGIYVQDLGIGVGGWSGGANTSLHLRVVGTREDVEFLRTRIAQAFDQELVQASRTITNKDSKAALVIHSPALESDEMKVAFFKALNEADPSLDGFMTYDVNGAPGIAIRTTGRNVKPDDAEQWASKYREAIEAAERSTGVDVDFTARNIELLIGGQHGEVDALRRAGTVGGRGELDDQLAARVREDLERTIDDVRAGNGDSRGTAEVRASGEFQPSGVEGPQPRPKAVQGSEFPRVVEPDLVQGKENYLVHGLHVTPDSQNIPMGSRFGTDVSSGVYVSGRTNAPHETFTHELGHFWQAYAPKGMIAKLKKAYGDDVESWVEAWVEYVLDLYPQRGIKNISPDLRDAFDTLSKNILKEAEANGGTFVRSGIPREIAEAFDTALWYKQLKGGALRGAEDFTGGIYTAVDPGFPVSLRHPLANVRHRLQSLSGMFQGRQGVKGGFKDPSIKKHFRGRSVESGWIKISSLGKAQYNSLLKAIRMDNVQVARAELLKASTDVPVHPDDIAVFVNPAQKAPPELKRFWDTVDQMGDKIAVNKMSLSEIDKLDKDLLERINETAFPTQIDGQPSRAVAAEIIEGLREPIDGVRWVSSDAFHGSELFSAPSAFYNRANTWGRMEAGGKVVDTVNDLMKLSLLPLNPAYAPMNLAGNLMLNLMQQGPFALINLPKAAFLARELGPDAATAIDYYMGRGIMHLGETEVLGRHYSASLSNVLGKVIDVVPRRAAFLHEARSMGFKSLQDVEQLLSNPAFRDELYEVTQRANDAIVDYERLSPFERKYLQRILFIYPWIRGATRYTYRFPMEHPIQAMAFAFLLERQQTMANEKLGDRPWYAQFDIPIGEVERFGQTYPLVINPEQLLPFTTPLDMANVLTGWATGSDISQSPIDSLQPFWPALVASITGYDAFSQQEVGRGPGTFIKEAADFPLRSAIENIGKSDAELADSAQNRLYPRNHNDELLKIGLGSLAPTPYNPEKGQRYAAGKRGKTPEQISREKASQIAGYYDPSLQPKVDLALSTKVEFDHAKDKAREQYNTDDLTDEQQVAVLLGVAMNHVDGLDKDYILSKLNVTTASTIRSALETELGWNILDAATAAANKAQKDQEAKAEGAVASAG